MARRQDPIEDNDQTQRPWSGPFGMGRQGWLIIALLIILAPLVLALIITALTGPHFA